MCVNALRLFFVMTAYSLPNIKELRGFDYSILRNIKPRNAKAKTYSMKIKYLLQLKFS